MQFSVALLAALAGAALAAPSPQVTADITPASPAPAGCSMNYPSAFDITVINVTSVSKRDLERRQTNQMGPLAITMAGGRLTDSQGRTGYIAGNNTQFQFDKPPQTGAIYTGGWSVCANGSLAIGGSTIFYECLSGDFYNLYYESQGAQCSAIYIKVAPYSSSAVATSAAPTQVSDGQVQATSAAASQISDGQIQATTRAVSQISDGQIQATTSAAAVSQISDGQIQATTSAGAKVSPIGDGQIQATTASGAKVSQISDGQIQATTASGAKVSQISDGQIQATTASGAKVSQISDGQIQATTASGAKVSQISDGQIQATTRASNATATYSAPAVYTGAAGSVTFGSEIMAMAVGLAAVAML